MSEQWRPAPNFPGYEVSDQGRVRSPRRILKPWHRNGYAQVSLRRKGQTVKASVHRLVLMAFVSPPGPNQDACHNNGDKGDNRLANLRWDTRAENIRDIVRHGRNVNANKTHCPRGHAFTPDNTYILRGRSRQCATCAKAAARASYLKKKQLRETA